MRAPLPLPARRGPPLGRALARPEGDLPRRAFPGWRRAWVRLTGRCSLFLAAACLAGAEIGPEPAVKRADQPALELRGWWVDAFHRGFKTPEQVRELVREARAGHFNALFVQVRRRGDVFYTSALEPKAAELAEDYDPLADLLEVAHGGEPRLEVHAWLVVFPAWNDRDRPPPAARHVARLHPDWLTRCVSGQTWDGANYCLDPGHPAVQQHLLDLVRELVDRYPVDGVHLDYIRYASKEFGYNPVALERFRRHHARADTPPPDDPAWLQFRRDQVTGLVRRLYLAASAPRPAFALSAATICFAPGPATPAAWTQMPAYADKLQDWRAWLQEGILDLNVPMAYFDRTVHARAWERWSAFARTERAGRHLALGVGAYLNAPAHTLEQIASAGEAGPETGPAEGVVCYSYAAPARPAADGPALLEALTAPAVGSRPGGPFARPAVPPAMGWKAAPSLGHCQGTVRGPDATPLEAATLELAGPVRRDLPADGNGWFGAVGLPPGRYRLRASAPGLEFRSAWCEIVPGETAEQDFTLAPPLGEDF